MFQEMIGNVLMMLGQYSEDFEKCSEMPVQKLAKILIISEHSTRNCTSPPTNYLRPFRRLFVEIAPWNKLYFQCQTSVNI